MKIRLIIFFCAIFSGLHAYSQFSPAEIAVKKNRLESMVTDSARINLCLDISNDYRYTDIDSSIHYANKAVELGRSIEDPVAEAAAISQLGFIVLETGDLPQSLQYQFTALDLADRATDLSIPAIILNRIGNVYMELGDFKKAVEYYRQSETLFREINHMPLAYNELSNIGNVYEMMGDLDSAKIYHRRVFEFSLTNTDRYSLTYAEMRDRYGNTEMRLGNYDTALMHYRIGIAEGIRDVDYRNLASIYLHMATLFFQRQQHDSSFHYAMKTIETARFVSWQKAIYEASGLMVQLFKLKNNLDSALVYAELAGAIKDSLYGPKKVHLLQSIMLSEQQKQQQLEKERIDTRNKIRAYAMLAGIGISILIAFLLYRNNLHRKKANILLQKQKQEIEQQKKAVEAALTDLRSTQAQLIQSEKMASLGELTAGIAHEIQNPLNFMNNFSEVNNELIEEVKSQKSKLKSEELDDLLNDIFQNNEKINHHGKRADAIVKGMLQHSRTSKGQKELTDINALCEEYLRLAYHGLRAKDKSFNAKFEANFDNSVGKIKVIPQDIGRVILNLANNAFYAVTEKKKQNVEGYEPTVTVTTMKLNGKVEIRVKDNGIGIPQKIMDKIFQPFFTTKPTGQGTGLGLSLSYDIVKVHAGKINVESKESEGSEFIIQLPIH